MGQASTILAACLAAFLIGWVGFLAFARQGAFMAVVLALSVLEATRDFALTPAVTFESAWYIGHTGEILTLGGVEIHIEDLITVIAAVAAMAGVMRFRGGPALAIALAGLTAIVIAGLIFFAGSEGFTHAVNHWRKWTLALALLAWSLTTPRAWCWRDMRWLVAAGFLAAILAIAEIRMRGLGSAAGLSLSDGEALNGRPLGPQAALMTLLAAWALVLMPGRMGWWRIAGTGLLAATVLAAQVRSVWIAAALSLLAFSIAHILRSGRAKLPRIAWAAVGAGTLLGGLSVIFAGSRMLQRSLSDQTTYAWRVERWRQSFAIGRTNLQWLFGEAFGPTPASVVDPSNGLYAHSLVVWAVETTGAIGCALAILVILLCCLRPSQLRAGSWTLVTGVTALGYGLTYGLPGWTWIAVGACAGWMAHRFEVGQLTAGDRQGSRPARPLVTATGHRPGPG